MVNKSTPGKWHSVAEIEIIYKSNIKNSERPKVGGSDDIARLLNDIWDVSKIDFLEQFKIILINRAGRILGIVDISSGGLTETVTDLRIIFATALKANASGIIIAHNHPSGSLTPSSADKSVTSQIAKAGELLRIKLIDHIIITSEGYLSFADEGLL
jgi:DNA repair protein RadC